MERGDFLVIYIIGDMRSGSTLLDYMLSKHPDAFSVGELHHLHSYFMRDRGMGVLFDWKCSCNKTVQECDFWSYVLEDVGFSKTYTTRLNLVKKTKLRRIKQGLFRFFFRSYYVDGSLEKLGEQFALHTWKLYDAIQRKSGKKVIIDSSKNALEAFFLNRYRRGEIRFLHLERDIRAVASSKYKRRMQISDETRKYWNPKQKSIHSLMRESYLQRYNNRKIAKQIKKSSKELNVKRIKYLNLTMNPQKTIDEICKFIDVEDFKVPLWSNDNPQTVHSICGSPSRGEKRRIQPDNRWKEDLKKDPFLYYYGAILDML